MTEPDSPSARPILPESPRPRYVRAVLLGFMASGKTVVGRRLAARLGWRHIDLDREIEAHAGRRIPEIFETEGEAGFRQLEVAMTPRFASIEHVVLSPGGGWVTNPGLFEALPPDTLTVWLKVSPQEVARRIANSVSQTTRPLLSGGDPLARIEQMLEVREPLYRKADIVVDTEGRRVDEIVQEVTRIIHGGGPPPAGRQSS